MRRTLLCPVLFAASLAGCTVQPTREVVVERPPEQREEVVIDEGAPPPDRVEVITVRPYGGAVWIRGHWMRERHRWIWVPGHWR